MIIKKLFHTYKEGFPLLKLQGARVYFPRGFNLDELFKNLILELSELNKIPKYCYITRHTDDTIPEEIIKKFKHNFSAFVDSVEEYSKFGIPTVWFVVFSENYESIDLIKTKLAEKNIKYFEDNPEEYDSINDIPPDGSYTTNNREAKMFPKFLHQVTQISIDLLKKTNAVTKLDELKELEGMRGNELDFKIEELKTHLINNSKYYLEKINGNNSEESEFWTNFKRVHIKQYIYSWPHFLFNTCGVRS